jgi:hypothetical protein
MGNLRWKFKDFGPLSCPQIRGLFRLWKYSSWILKWLLHFYACCNFSLFAQPTDNLKYSITPLLQMPFPYSFRTAVPLAKVSVPENVTTVFNTVR